MKKIWRHLYPVTFLLIIGVIAYGLFYAPILYNDDWALIIGRWYSGSLRWFSVEELRPLQLAPLMIIYGIFGVNVPLLYMIVWILNVLAAIQLYFLLLRLLPDSRVIVLTIAALFLVYPADFSRMWLTQIHGRLAIVFSLLYAHLLLDYAETKRYWSLGVALLALICSFAVYEAQFGLTMTWCLFVIFLYRKSPVKTLLGLLSPFVVGGIFILWRTFGYSWLGITDYYQYIDRFQLTPLVIINRLIMGLQALTWAWLEPLTHAFGLAGWQAMIILLAAILLSILLVYKVAGYFYSANKLRLNSQQHTGQLSRFMAMLPIGALFIMAGYLPFVTVFQPTLIQAGSRVNLFALPGASVVLVSLLGIILLILRRWQQSHFLVLAGLFPLILLGMLAQARVQYDDRAAWEEQKQIWHQLFALAPNLRDGTSVHIILPDNQNVPASLNRNGQRPALFASWDVSPAVNILYGKQTLKGDVTSPKVLLQAGIKDSYSDEITPYNQVLLVRYDRESQRLTIIEDLQAAKLVDFPVTDYQPFERIIQTPTTRTALRRLVEFPSAPLEK